MPVKLNRQAGNSRLYLLGTQLCLPVAGRYDVIYWALPVKRVEYMLRERLYPESGSTVSRTRRTKKKVSPDIVYLLLALRNYVTTFLTVAIVTGKKVIDNFNATGFNRVYTILLRLNNKLTGRKERKKGLNSTGDSNMAWNLLYQELNFNLCVWKERVVEMLKKLPGATLNYISTINFWKRLQQNSWVLSNATVKNVCNSASRYKEILHIFMPNKVIQVFANKNRYFTLFTGHGLSANHLIFVCKNNTCLTPVPVVKTSIRLFNNNRSLINLMGNNNMPYSLQLAERQVEEHQ